MKFLLITCACVTLGTASALACRGTAEYPQVAKQLAQSDHLSAADKEALSKRLKAGEELHRQGHRTDSMDVQKKSLQILDEIKAKIAK